MKKSAATGEDVLEMALAVIELYFRLEAVTQATAGFAQAGGEFGTLRVLALGGPQTVPDIARSRPVSRQHCQTIANNLAAQGLAEFIDNPRHKRSKLLRITRKGSARYEAMRAQFTAAAAVYAPHFTASEVHAATDVCQRARDLIQV